MIDAAVILTAVLGLSFQAIAALGVLRMPDFYTRLHAVAKTETLGVLLTCLAVAIAADSALVAGKILLLALFLVLANPTSTHALSRAALRTGLRAWQRRERAGKT